MLAKKILVLNRDKISKIALIRSAAKIEIDNAISEIDRVIELLEMVNCDDYEFTEALKILKG